MCCRVAALKIDVVVRSSRDQAVVDRVDRDRRLVLLVLQLRRVVAPDCDLRVALKVGRDAVTTGGLETCVRAQPDSHIDETRVRRNRGPRCWSRRRLLASDSGRREGAEEKCGRPERPVENDEGKGEHSLCGRLCSQGCRAPS